MSGSSNKRSRRTQQQVTKHMQTLANKLEQDRQQAAPSIIDEYQARIKKLPFHKRFVVCWRILFKS